MNNRIILLTIACFVLFISISDLWAAPAWKKIDEGLFVGEFLAHPKATHGDSKIIIIKINPQKYQLKLMSVSQYNHSNLTAKEWCNKYKLITAINAGMFQQDYKSNVGYMKNFKHINNKRVSSKYLSVAAFNPVNESGEVFKMFDTDETPMKTILADYNTVVQNLRLIKRPGQNRWSRQNKKWSEAALGQDKEGNILFIFSRSPHSMHDLNHILLKLPIGLQCAQHLEGGPEASLYFSHKDTTLELMGSFETNFNENSENTHFWPLPNILGIVKKH
ncbi:MAG: phosphodiester glycosidase family protein [bacterium]|nr:phosphodiester glycosidase family protein [bacterium]